MNESELFQEQPRAFSVNYIVSRIQDNIKNDSSLQNIYVLGEITEFKQNSSSGHIYFSITDKNPEYTGKGKAVLRGAMWKSKAYNIKKLPSIGDEVIVMGSIDIYAPSSGYNLIAESFQYAGEGDLYKEIEKIRKRLREEGLTDPSRKKKLPVLPKKIGIISGMNTAALKDILKQIEDRYPYVDLVLAPAIMQGEKSPISIMNAVDEIIKNKYSIEILIIARGGGSQEDLSAFNDETLARKIASVSVPVITGIGHEVDHPIIDDVADVAAATPTDAAKLALPDVNELTRQLQIRFQYLESSVQQIYEKSTSRYEFLADKPFYKDPYKLIETRYHYLDDLQNRLKDSLRYVIDTSLDSFHQLSEIDYLFERILKNAENRYMNTQSRLEAYAPLATLKRGYSVAYHNKHIISSIKNLKKNDMLEIQMIDGKIETVISRISN